MENDKNVFVETVCERNMCCGCKLCETVCTKDAIKIEDNLRTLNAVIDAEKCVSCGLCHKMCPQNNPPSKNNPSYWFQGWADDDIRTNSSSGGFATALSMHFIRGGGVVYSCKFDNGDLVYSSAHSIDEIRCFSGSKYVKSNPDGIYLAIKNDLENNTKVLFIGLPCHVGALKNYISPKLQEYLYTVDLICHGTPSVKLLDMALREYGYKLRELRDILFRRNDRFAVEIANKTIVTKGTCDRYTIGFLHGLFYTQNCYSCYYAGIERVGDITLGDSWGTHYKSELCKGISLAVCQTNKGYNLLQNSGLTLISVDKDVAIANNEQLRQPYSLAPNREVFFAALDSGYTFKKAVSKSLPVECAKQRIKGLLIKIKMWEIVKKIVSRK